MWQNWSVSSISHIDHSSRRLRVACWTPLAPVASGISDYSEALLEHLKDFVDLDVFIDGYTPERRALWDGIHVLDHHAFQGRHASRPYDINLFHLGNHSYHAYMYPALLHAPCPSVAVFHDGSFYHLLEGVSVPTLLSDIRREEGIIAMLKEWKRHARGQTDCYTHTVLRRLACACDGILVHSEFMAQRCRAVASKVPVRVVPFGTERYEEDGGKFQPVARQVLGLPQDALIFGVFGHMNPAKRIEQVLDAFNMQHNPNCYLYLAGPIGARAPQALKVLADDHDAARRAHLLIDDGYLPYARIFLAMHAVDVGINLRFPTTGETSATLCSLLSMGKPVIVSDVGAFSEFPNECVMKIPVDETESVHLSRVMRRFAEDSALRCAMRQAARTYSQEHTWEHTAQSYVEFLTHILNQI